MTHLNIKYSDLYIQDGVAKGYVDLRNIIYNKLADYPFIFLIGARGIGKTYGAVEITNEDKQRCVFMRRTQTQCDSISTVELFQGATYCKDHGVLYNVAPITKNVYGVTFGESDEYMMIQCALSTMYNIRGFDLSDREIFWYDEFLPEKHAKAIRNEGMALLNAYETINRNRELQGRKPLKFIGMSNSDRLDNPIFADFNLITPCDKQFSKGQIYYADKERGVAVINFIDSPISKKKKETALYKFSKGMDFEDMALENNFLDEKSEQKSYSLKSLIPAINVGEITIYKHKLNGDFYVSSHHIDAKIAYQNTERDLTAWRKSNFCRACYLMYLDGQLFFENYNCEYLFKRYCENK